ncbi:conserved hypothetical protein [Candidatus Terasakiella magnetica]|uniref:Uncharacterized protein n=1 Tax=Candidatus Terasakiella magnetica TaxID=1867952 RepID=A0A1C3RG70_9PROT|nr:hypothetical protein [Candidatus Terasakiella magnetica]SCA56297.1 conserved hypothetical protein [Candidatus Terasakiella magnetica]
MSNLPDAAEIANDIGSWLDEMAEGLEPGRFKYCKTGSITPSGGQEADMVTCFAVKAAWQCGQWDKWSDERKKGCINFIRSFQREDGFFYDPWLKKSTYLNWRDFAFAALGRSNLFTAPARHRKQRILNVRAETRQAIGTLMMVGEKPNYPVQMEVTTPEQVTQYINDLDWTHPWGAGSHLSHILMMLSANRSLFQQTELYDKLVPEILNFFKSIYHPEDGTWYKGSVTDNQLKINGAMKVYTGLGWLDDEVFPNKAAIDLALSTPLPQDGCGFTNNLFVIQRASRGLNKPYRADEIKTRAKEAIEIALKNKKEGSSFSFQRHGSQKYYYSQYTSKGHNVADIHGTAMFTWGLALAFELLGNDAPKGAENWQTHRP